MSYHNFFTKTIGIFCIVLVLIYQVYQLRSQQPDSESVYFSEQPSNHSLKSEEKPGTIFSTESFTTSSLSSNITLVTAFFDIGSFQKGDSQEYTPANYIQWMSVFQFIDNPLYVYVDEEKHAILFRRIRGGSLRNKTKIIVLDRKKLWSFNLKPNISEIFSDPNYPKHYPNTVNADYSCAMHAKYEVIQKSTKDNAFNTKYFAWLDVGFFRDIMNETHQPFKIHIPPQFVLTRVAYNEVFSHWRRTLQDIMHNNQIWVGGGFFIAELSVMGKWVEDYMYFTERFIEQKLINTDQQVIYAMSQPSIHKKLGKRRVPILRYIGTKPSKWLYLGYLCKE